MVKHAYMYIHHAKIGGIIILKKVMKPLTASPFHETLTQKLSLTFDIIFA